jgi:hypothetical protein
MGEISAGVPRRGYEGTSQASDRVNLQLKRCGLPGLKIETWGTHGARESHESLRCSIIFALYETA